MPRRIRNTSRKVGLRKSPSQQRGWLRSINIFTTVMNSNGRFSDAGRVPVKLRVTAHSKSTSIDRPSASEKISRACLFVPTNARPYERRRRVPLIRPFSLRAHTSAKMRAQTWPSTYRIRFFVLALRGSFLTWRANA